MAPKNESQKSGVGKKGKSFNNVCSNFTNACSDINMEGDDPTSELLDLLRATTDNARVRPHDSESREIMIASRQCFVIKNRYENR